MRMTSNDQQGTDPDLDLWQLEKKLRLNLELEKERLREWKCLAIQQWAKNEEEREHLDLSQAEEIPECLLEMRNPLSSTSFHRLTVPLQRWRLRQTNNKIQASVSGEISFVTKCAFAIDDFPDIFVAVEFTKKSDFIHSSSDLNDIGGLRIALPKVDGKELLVIPEETSPLIQYCEKYCDFKTAMDGIHQYLLLSQNRIDDIGTNGHVETLEGGGLRIGMENEKGSCLAKMEWKIEFRESTCSFQQAYRVKMEPKGIEAATDCGFPSEIYTNGFCEFWDANYCFENLLKMVNFDVSSPVKGKSSKGRTTRT